MSTSARRVIKFQHILLCFIYGLALLTGCTKAGIQAADVLKNKTVHVALAWETDKEGAVVENSNDHPYEISAGKIGSILSSLQYSEKIFLKWEEKGPLFDEIEVKRIAAPISQALGRAGKNQWVSFEVNSLRRRLIFKTRMMTSGWVWIKDGKLHLVIGNFRYELDQEGSEAYRGDPRLHFSMESSRIDKGEYNGPPPVEENTKYLHKEHLNWTVVDLQTFTPSQKKTEEAAPRMSAEERLEQLKKLFDKGLITQEEYEAKRKEILEEL